MTSILEAMIERRLNLTWRMLATIGAPVASKPIAVLPADPECTFLLACYGAKDDARSAELSVWLARNARHILSVGRAKTVAKRTSESMRAALEECGATLRKLDVADGWPSGVGRDAQPWNITIDLSRLDERMGRARLSHAVIAASATHGIRLRMAFGLSSRADALAMLIGRSAEEQGRAAWMGLAELDEATGWGRRSLLSALSDMASSGLIKQRTHRGGHQFSASSTLLPELGPAPENWVSWPGRLVQLIAVEDAAQVVTSAQTMTSVLEQCAVLAARLPSDAPTFEPAGDPATLVERFLAWCDERSIAQVADLDS
jgi:hypothetical protein